MKKNWMVIGGILGGLLLVFLYVQGTYNKAVRLQEGVKARWSDVGATYQRRLDLIPNLVATVKGSAAFETKLQTDVTGLRAKVGSAATPTQMDRIGAEINTLIAATFEAYPQVRSTENFADLQAQLEGTENRINHARQQFNESVRAHNSFIRRLLPRIVLSFWGDLFSAHEGFEAAEGAEKAPEVAF